jgi:flagellar hook-associated protein 2
MTFIDDNSRYDTATNQGGMFLGNQSASRIQQSLRTTIQNVVPGTNPLANRLSSVGITFNDSGKLVLDKTKLQNALNGNIEGVDARDVQKLFAFGGESTSAGISFVLGSSRTKAPANGVGVDISQAAEQAVIVGGTALPVSTVITAANRTLELTLDGKTATVNLSEGTYTAQELADHLESVINESTELPGRKVTASLNGGALELSSVSYGTSSAIKIVSGTAVTDLGFTAGQSDTGRDVVGSFIVDGKTESAVGRGRILAGDSKNENTADLQLSVTLTPGQVVAGIEGTVTVSRGLASSLDQVIGQLINTETGILTSVDDGFTRQIESVDKSIERQTTLFDLQEASIRQQFQALETAISQMNATSSYLGGQLASLPQINNR